MVPKRKGSNVISDNNSMSGVQTLGSHARVSRGPCEYLTLVFSPLSAPLRSRWRNNGLSADFLSDYVTTFLPRSDDSASPAVLQDEVKHAVSSIANELLENAMKYHEKLIDTPIQIRLELSTDYVTISASNGVGRDQAQQYKAFIHNLLTEDPGELMMRQLEAASLESSDASSVGLLTMMSDYGAELGWCFDSESTETNSVTVTTRAMLSLKNILGVSA